MKIIASDYDGTLHYHGISEKVRRAIRYWQSLGNRFGIVSGRGIYNILAAVRHEKVDCDFLIANNGAVIADGEGNILRYHTADPSLVPQIAAFLTENGCAYACVNDLVGDLFLCTAEEKENRHRDDARFVLFHEFSGNIAFTQISTVCREESLAEELTKRLNRAFMGKITAFQNGICIDIVPYGVDKAKGIEDLIGIYGALREDVAAVGDNKNDIAMLRAFRSYAVANAVDSVKAIASFCVDDISELVERELTL